MNLKNILWNLFGVGVPILFAICTIPFLIKLIGLERFGLLTIAWGLLGKVGLFDLGIGRATTQHVAKLIGQQQHHQIPGVVHIAMRMTLVAGSAAATLLIIAVVCGVTSFFKTTPDISSELYWAAIVLSLGLPLQALSATLRGINEAFSDFRGISLVRVFLGIVHFLGPFLVAMVTQHLALVVATLIASRLVAVWSYYRLAQKHIRTQQEPGKSQPLNSAELRKQLLGFGGWLTVGAGAGFLLNQSERIGIGVILAATVIAAFSIPFEVVLQSTVIVTAISTIAFPQLSAMIQKSPTQASNRFHAWMFKTIGVMAIVCVTLAIGLPVFLPLWIGDDLPDQAIWIGQLLCVGVLFRTANVMTCSMLHACGRADLTTKVRLLEIPIYWLALYFLLINFGVVGAAYGWLFRMVLDACAQYFAFRRFAVPQMQADFSLDESAIAAH